MNGKDTGFSQVAGIILDSIINNKPNQAYMDIPTLFNQSLKKWYCPNSTDCICGNDLADSEKAVIRPNFGISLDEIILFKRDTSFWSSNDQGLVITDLGIYCIPDNEDESSSFTLSWKEFDNVKYKELSFYFYNGNEQVCKITKDFFYKGSDVNISFYGPRLAEILTQIAQLQEPDVNPLDLTEEGRFDEALTIAENKILTDPNDVSAHFAKARILYVKECQKENVEDIDEKVLDVALKELQNAKDLTDSENAGDLSLINLNMGYVYQVLGQGYQARNAFVEALDGCDKDAGAHIMQELEDTENYLKDIWDNYTSIYEYKERKFIMPVRDFDIGGCVVYGVDVFRMSNVPSCFKFPTGHPVPNQLYIGHPYNPSLYVPFEESEDIFFLDKVHELCYLLECLGAEEINITSIKGRSVSELTDSQGNYNGSAEIKLLSGEVNTEFHSHHQGEMTSHNQRTMSIRHDPMRMPFLPEGLIWYDEQPQWQRLVNSRMNGNMLEYNEFVSTSQTKFTSNSEKNDIKAAAERLWTKLNVEIDRNIETQFKEATETQWKVEVKFRSIKKFMNLTEQISQVAPQELKQIDNSQLSKDEQSYAEAVKFYLEDGDIGDNERRFLERKRSKLGISPERAAEIEKSLQKPQMTNEEQNYAEEVKFCLEDGAIGDTERRFLERMRTKFGISPERAAEIEESLQKPQLTEEEQEYLDAVYDEMVDGVVPESARRLLNRLRRSMDISEDRAMEIERYAVRNINA